MSNSKKQVYCVSGHQQIIVDDVQSVFELYCYDIAAKYVEVQKRFSLHLK